MISKQQNRQATSLFVPTHVGTGSVHRVLGSLFRQADYASRRKAFRTSWLASQGPTASMPGQALSFFAETR